MTHILKIKLALSVLIMTFSNVTLAETENQYPSSKLKFSGSITRSICSVNNMRSTPITIPSNAKKNTAIPFELTLSGCDTTINEVRFGFYDLSKEKSKDISFIVNETDGSPIDLNGQDKLNPMQLSGRYISNGEDKSASKLLIVSYR